MHMNLPCGMQHVSVMSFHAFSFMCVHHGIWLGSPPGFLRTADFGDSQKVRWGPPVVAVKAAWHARSLSHAIFDAHAVSHAARAHIERERDRPGPEPSLATACSAAQVHTACMFMHALFFG